MSSRDKGHNNSGSAGAVAEANRCSKGDSLLIMNLAVRYGSYFGYRGKILKIAYNEREEKCTFHIQILKWFLKPC